MAGRRKYLAFGLALALAMPTSVYAQEAAIENEIYVINTEKILDINENVVGMIQFTSDVDPDTYVQGLELTATVYTKNDEEYLPLEGVTYTWVDPYAEETPDDDSINNLPTYSVSGIGTYTVKVDLTNASTVWDLDSKELSFSVDIQNVDITAPVILSVTTTPTEWTKDKVKVTVECADNQPLVGSQEEEKTGSGLHSMPYSFDGGVTWSNKNTTIVKENKTIEFIVRDAIGNQSTQTIEITNIDKTAPTVSLTATDEKDANGNFILTATASDAESGLADLAYSWDNGQNWNAGSKATINVEGTFTVTVRDKVGNTATASVTIVEKVPETGDDSGSGSETPDGGSDSGSETPDDGSGSGSGTTGDGSGSGSGSGSGTTGDGSGSGSGTTGNGSDSGSGTTGSGSSTGNTDWDDNNYVSGVVDTTETETDETETEETETKETETDETKETKETKESKETKETETKDGVVIPGKDEDKGFTFPIGLALIIAAILIVLSIIILVIKMMMDRHAEAVAAADDDDEDMRKVYARVNKEETKVISAAAAAKAAEEAAKAETAKKAETSDIHFEDLEVEEAIGAAVTAAIATEEPVVKKIHRKQEPAPGVTPAVNPEDEISIGEFAAAAVAAGVAVVENEKEMEAAISEMEEEKAAIQASAANPTESVVIEGAHSRLIIDPETGEYTYEFK